MTSALETALFAQVEAMRHKIRELEAEIEVHKAEKRALEIKLHDVGEQAKQGDMFNSRDIYPGHNYGGEI